MRYKVLGYNVPDKAGIELDDAPDECSAIASMARHSQEWQYLMVKSPNGTVIARYSQDGAGL